MYRSNMPTPQRIKKYKGVVKNALCKIYFIPQTVFSFRIVEDEIA